MTVSNDQFDKEFIHFSQIADGVTEAGGLEEDITEEQFFILKGF